jgi:hypothetical protein
MSLSSMVIPYASACKQLQVTTETQLFQELSLSGKALLMR